MSKLKSNPFYLEVLLKELKVGTLQLKDRILVVCGGNLDRVTLLEAGFSNVVISNLAPHNDHEEYSPFVWQYQNAEQLESDDESFDVAIVHSGLHHCYNPNQGLAELCRVSKKMVIMFEPYDTWITRLGAVLGYGQQYEDTAVHENNGLRGGVANTEIPNYVYRYSDSEVRKFARAFMPYGESPIRIYRALRINVGRFKKLKNPLYRISFKLAYPILRGLSVIIPCFNNNCSFAIQKPSAKDYHPWITEIQGVPRVNREYLENKYGAFPESPGKENRQ